MTTEMSQLKTILARDFSFRSFDRSIDAETLAAAEEIVTRVKTNGETAIRQYAETFGERNSDESLVIGRPELESATQRIPHQQRELLERVAQRIRDFAEAQRQSLKPISVDVPGGQAGHTIEPVQRAGCYAPAGRFPLPSTVLMTAVTAKVAGCPFVIVATPSPSDLMLAAASIAGADQVLPIGGAHAIAAMAYGFEQLAPVDLIAGPGSRWVTAGKKLVQGDVGIDMLAGPSELVLVADDSAHPERVAADLLAQAEHDTDARVFLVTDSNKLIDDVNAELASQLELLPTRETAQVAVAGGAAILCQSIDGETEDAVSIANQLAPEHLELHVRDPQPVASRIRNAGCVFIGHQSAEVFGDYGVGPNHTLPTAGTARWSAGLNVFTFLRIRTWIELSQAPAELIQDTAELAELEGLIGHQRAGLARSNHG